MSSTTLTLTGKIWVAIGPSGVVGSIHQSRAGFTFKLLRDSDYRAIFPTLDIAKQALHASLLPGSERSEFREH